MFSMIEEIISQNNEILNDLRAIKTNNKTISDAIAKIVVQNEILKTVYDKSKIPS